MKISKEAHILHTSVPTNKGALLAKVWEDAAIQVGLDTGVHVLVKIDYWAGSGGDIQRIYFQVMDHEFESEKELRRALALKAFL
jgi:hypothetical protein